MKNYKSRSGSWPSKVIAYLAENGETKKKTICDGTGMTTGVPAYSFYDRPGYYLDVLLRRLIARGVVRRTRRGYYELTEQTLKLF